MFIFLLYYVIYCIALLLHSIWQQIGVVLIRVIIYVFKKIISYTLEYYIRKWLDKRRLNGNQPKA